MGCVRSRPSVARHISGAIPVEEKGQGHRHSCHPRSVLGATDALTHVRPSLSLTRTSITGASPQAHPQITACLRTYVPAAGATMMLSGSSPYTGRVVPSGNGSL